MAAEFARDALSGLVAKSMLTTDETSDGTTRYRQLETLRQYARERLDDLGDPDVWRRRHAEHYAEFAEQAGAELVGPEELAWRARLMRELDNLRAAVGWSLDAESPDDRGPAIRVVVALSNEANSGTAFEVGSWAERTLPLARASPLSSAPPSSMPRRGTPPHG
jgi:non-specific serine/threonine protein kinase